MVLNELKGQRPAVTTHIPPVRDVSQEQKFTVDVNAFQSLLPLIVTSTEAKIMW
jgi:hypothetical protein